METGSDFRIGSEDTLKYTGFWILDFGVLILDSDTLNYLGSEMGIPWGMPPPKV